MKKRIAYWFRSFKRVKTVAQAKEMGLVHMENVHGDAINRLDCRSLWLDEFDNTYKCDELYYA